MLHKIIKTENYLITVGGHFKLNDFPYLVLERLTTGEFHLWQVDNENDWDDKNQYQILSHLPLNNSPILEDFDLLPELEINDSKLPVGFESEIELIGFQDEGDLEVPKSYIDSYNRVIWVGKYIY